jgi:hypothetical protein
VNELVENLNAKRAKMRRKLTTDEAITALERGCITARKDWGLQMRNNKCVVRRRRARRRRGVFVGPRPSLPRSPIPDTCTWITLNPEPLIIACPPARRVTPVYSNDHTVARAEGSWISTFVVNACGEVIGEHDETVLRAWKSSTPLLELQGRVCKTGKHGATGPGEGDGSNSKIDDSYPNGLGVCPATADMSLVNTHDDGWSSWDGPQHKKGGANTPVQKNPPEMKVEL